MGFLDASGNIILDAVITDEGKMRLAKGDGSFKIVKFALGDEEVNYTLFNKNHPSGSAYYDLEIMQTPILEAFTNNTSTMKTKLITIPRNNLLYLPVIKLNELQTGTARHSNGAFVVAVNSDTEALFSTISGVMLGETLNGGAIIRCDQGLNSNGELSPSFAIDADLFETQYIAEIDNRFGKLVSTNGTVARVSFIDDDFIGSYFLSLGTDIEFVSENQEKRSIPTETIDGPRGSILQFRLQSSLELNSSSYLFTKLGSTTTMTDKNGATQTVNYIDTTIRITGATTGAKVDIPVRFIKV